MIQSSMKQSSISSARLQHFSRMLQHAVSLAFSTDHTCNLLNAVLVFEQGYSRQGSSFFDTFFNEIVAVSVGGNLRKMSDANHLVFLRQPLQLLAHDVSCLSPNADVDLIENQALSAPIKGSDGLQG